MSNLDKLTPQRAGGYGPGGRVGGNPYRAWVRRAACAGKSELFSDPARVSEALTICARCPVLSDCRGWALHNAVDCVAGGLTVTAREQWRRANGIREPRVSADDFLAIDLTSSDFTKRAIRAEPVLAAVARWTREGQSGREIAARLGCSRRQAVRLRVMSREREQAS